MDGKMRAEIDYENAARQARDIRRPGRFHVDRNIPKLPTYYLNYDKINWGQSGKTENASE